MSERVIREFKVIELEDGFRIEIRGDKERLREMLEGPGAFGFGSFACGPGMFRGPRFFGRHWHGWGPPHGWGPGHGPWWEEEPRPGDAPPEGA